MLVLIEEENGVFRYTTFSRKDTLHNAVLHTLSFRFSDDLPRQDALIREMAPAVLEDRCEDVNEVLDAEDEDASVFWGEASNGAGSPTHVLVCFSQETGDLTARPLRVGEENVLWQAALAQYRAIWWNRHQEYAVWSDDPTRLQRALECADLAVVTTLWPPDWERWEVHPITGHTP